MEGTVEVVEDPEVCLVCREGSELEGESMVGEDGREEGDVGRVWGEYVIDAAVGGSSEVDDVTWSKSVSIWGSEKQLCQVIMDSPS